MVNIHVHIDTQTFTYETKLYLYVSWKLREEKEETKEKTTAISKALSAFGQLVSALVWKLLKWFSVYIGLSEGIELITEDQKQLSH